MSAFIHDDGSYDAIFATLTHNKELWWYNHYDGTLLQFVSMLRIWNYRSVNHRYHKNTDPDPYVPQPAVSLTPIALFKLLNSIDYQSCEIQEWYNSPEKIELSRIQLRIAEKFIPKNDEYKNAPWEVTRS